MTFPFVGADSSRPFSAFRLFAFSLFILASRHFGISASSSLAFFLPIPESHPFFASIFPLFFFSV
jgi:hypothetical protein